MSPDNTCDFLGRALRLQLENPRVARNPLVTRIRIAAVAGATLMCLGALNGDPNLISAGMVAGRAIERHNAATQEARKGEQSLQPRLLDRPLARRTYAFG